MTLFVTGTNTNIGKSYTMLYLIKKLSKMGYRVGVYKPIETGFVETKDSDAYALLQEAKKYNSNFDNLQIYDILSYRFSLPASPYVAKKNTIIDTSMLQEHCKNLLSKCDILLIEGAGGLNVPIEKDLMMIDLIDLFNAKTLLVSPSNLGCINDLLLSIDALSSKNINFDWVVNLHKDKDTFYEVTYPYYKNKFDNINILEKDDSHMIDFITKGLY